MAYTKDNITIGLDSYGGSKEVCKDKHVKKWQKIIDKIEAMPHRYIWICIDGLNNINGTYMTNSMRDDNLYHCCMGGGSTHMRPDGSSSTIGGPWIVLGIDENGKRYWDRMGERVYPRFQNIDKNYYVKKTFWTWMDTPRADGGMYFDIDRPVMYLYF